MYKQEKAKQEIRKIINKMCCERCIDKKLCAVGCYVPEWKENCDKEVEKYFAQQTQQSN